MRPDHLPLLFRLLGILAAAVAAAGIGLEAWCAHDRARFASVRDPVDDAARAVFTQPSAQAFSRLARANGASGNPVGAAYAAAVASRLAPDDAGLAAEASRAENAAVRDRLRGYARPAATLSLATLAVLGIAAFARRRERALVLQACASASASIRLDAEGSRPSPGCAAMVDATTRALVLDVRLPERLAGLKRPPAVVATLSSSTAGRTVRLSPRTDLQSGALRWRIDGETLAVLASEPGRWRVLVRAGPALLGVSEVLVSPGAHRRAA